MRLKALEQHIATGRVLRLFGGTSGEHREISRNTSARRVRDRNLEKKGDDRGFLRAASASANSGIEGLETRFVADEQSLSSETGTLRGLHYQLTTAAE